MFKKDKEAQIDDLYNEEPIKAPALRKTVSIGVCGCMSRIGTTTQALQIAEYLFFSGKSVAYVEVNSTGFLKNLEETYYDIERTKDGSLYYNRVTLIEEENLAKVKSKYEYLVYDFGSVLSPDCKTSMFNEMDIKVLCGGSKPSELVTMTDALTKPVSNDCNFMFSFVPKDDEDGIRQMMGERKESVYFSRYSPNYFESNPKMEFVYQRFIPITEDER